MKILFHCQHSVGIGHLVRTLQLAEACLDLGQVTVICGGEIPSNLHIHSRIHIEKLPPLNMAPGGALFDPSCREEVTTVFKERQEKVRQIARKFSPDCLIVEMFPFGRKKFAGEILALIDAVREKPSCKIFCSVRDVLVTTRHDQAAYDRRAVDWLNKEFDAVLVHSDPSLISFDKTFSMYDSIAIPIHYTGYISRNRARTASPRNPVVVVSAGSGRVGKNLIDIAEKSAELLHEKLDCELLLVTGPLNGKQNSSRLATSFTKKVAFINDLPEVLANARLSISQCGYNTATDILGSDVPAVFVPFEAPGENEQSRRAELLARCGRAIAVKQSSLTVNVLVDAAGRALLLGDQADKATNFDLDGAHRSRTIISECLNSV